MYIVYYNVHGYPFTGVGKWYASSLQNCQSREFDPYRQYQVTF